MNFWNETNLQPKSITENAAAKNEKKNSSLEALKTGWNTVD